MRKPKSKPGFIRALGDDNELLTTRHVSEITKLQESTLRHMRWARSNQKCGPDGSPLEYGPVYFHIGRKVAYRRADVMTWLGSKQSVEAQNNEIK